jgi:integrase
MGFSCFRTPEYLYHTNTGLLVFRIAVPLDCRPTIQKTEIHYSLKTRCIYSARKSIASILPFLREVFEGIRQGMYSVLSQVDLGRIIRDGIRESIREPLVNHRITIVVNSVEPVEPENRVSQSFPPRSEHQKAANTAPAATSKSKDKPPEPTFSDLQRNFFMEKEVSKGWREKTQEDHEAVFNLFREIFGDIAVSRIDKTIMRDFKATIMQLPPNMRKISKYKKKTVKQIVAMKPRETLSPHTINKYLSRLSNLFSYAVSHGYMAVNPANSMKVRLRIRPDEERKAYTQEDLIRLFREPDHSASYCYWTPLIALYTGCRLEEICQLHLEDIRQDDEVWVFDINGKHEKNLKTLSSVRLIPIHPQLIALGLLDHVAFLKDKGEKRLFPELRQRRDGYGQTVSKWFQRYKVRCGIEEGKTFHSFRHTFITHLKHKQVDPFMIHELDGHTVNSETMGRYGKRYTPEILLREAIEKIDFGLIEQ